MGSLYGGGIYAQYRVRWEMGLVERRGAMKKLGKRAIGCAVGAMVEACDVG